MIETFLFDLGNVLVRFSHERMCAQIGALCGRSSAEMRRLLIDSQLQWEFERGKLTEQEFHQRLQKVVAHSLELQELVHAGSDIFELNSPVVPIVETLRARGHRLVLLSNTSISHFEFVSRNFDILRHFDDFVLSYEVGALKPEGTIFHEALKKIQCPPERCFYTDDIPEYVAAGRTHGLQAEVFTTAEALAGHLSQRGITLPQTAKP